MATLPTRVRPQTFETSADQPRRPFGSNYAPQSRTYLLHFPFVLGIFGAIVWAFPTNAMFVVGALVGSLVGIYVLIDVLFRFAPLRLTTLFGMTILLGYNLGSFNTWLTMQRGNLTLAESFARAPEALGHAVSACMITAAVLFVAGELFERPIFGKDFYLPFGTGTLPFVLSTTIFLLAAYTSGKVGYMGLAVDDSGHIDPATQLFLWWYFPAYAYSVCAAFNTVGATRLIISFLAIIETVAMVPLGRRQFAFGLILAIIALRLGRYRLRLPVYQKVLIGIAAVVLITIASVSFLYLRFAGYEVRGNGRVSIAERLEGAYDLLHKRTPAEILSLLGTNVSQRTFVIGFFSDLLEASQHSTPLLGKDLLYNLQLTVPSIISPDKFGIEPYDEEALVDMQWGFSYRDEANSLITAGAADFGFLGVLLYPLALLFMLRIALEWVQHAVPTKWAVILSLAYVLQSLAAEAVPVDYFLQIRSTILVVAILYLLSRLPRIRLQPSA
jgi:hypothetical protein